MVYASTAVTTGRSVGEEDHWTACAAKAVTGPGQTGQRGASRTPTQLQAQRSLGLSTEEAECSEDSRVSQSQGLPDEKKQNVLQKLLPDTEFYQSVMWIPP